ncbi:MAG TPA: hypothetical protein VFW95_07445 [Candidatus Limnocylindria bacterium]|nr:hypothetical protein [Candidatus Limnocylindria bacterium]
MATLRFADGTVQTVSTERYEPGVCNIGPAEIAKRRRAGIIGTLATVALLVLLVALHVAPIVRLILFVPAAVAASGFIQAQMKFCAGFAALGIFNFGGEGDRVKIAEPEARARDRRRGRQISVASFVIGAGVAVLAVLIPV